MMQTSVARRIAAIDWQNVRCALDQFGYARLPALLDESECESLRAIYGDEAQFRKLIDMGGHNYGRGDYRYFAYPLPDLVSALRVALYPPLASIANEWASQLSGEASCPADLAGFLSDCAAAGQARPTPLLLHYQTDGYNRMHQDLYGELAFPLQVACLLSRSGSEKNREFTGGAFLLSEHRPRTQARTEAIDLLRGEGLIFATRERPVASARGFARATMRHGVSRLLSGERYALGVIFHDGS